MKEQEYKGPPPPKLSELKKTPPEIPFSVDIVLENPAFTGFLSEFKDLNDLDPEKDAETIKERYEAFKAYEKLSREMTAHVKEKYSKSLKVNLPEAQLAEIPAELKRQAAENPKAFVESV